MTYMYCIYKEAKIQIRMDEFGDIRYQHPLTGEWCESVDQTLWGWSEVSSEANEEWQILVGIIKSGCVDGHVADGIDYIIEASYNTLPINRPETG